ncbi:hypothetical protein [Exiguobacterium sp. UBA4551]|uniref:hypothetical protein n=1 Tax=Exiguobacterium sp. UBA4551 TaxID=1946494 RepID=UPI00105811EF|nr:hypothetical protein [Exiguobacterium sp. UBA4551]
MLRESRIFEPERLEYQQLFNYSGYYPMGTFLPARNQELNQTLVQMVPTSSTYVMYDTLRENFGYIPFKESYQKDHTIYTVSGVGARKVVQRFYGVTAQITNMTAEFLDTTGIHLPHHTIQLVELTNDDRLFYYVLTGGKGPIEAKTDELYNAKKLLRQADNILLFRIEQEGLTVDTMSIVELAIAMSNDAFDRNWTVVDPLHAHELFAIESDQMIDLHESTKWQSLNEFDDWTKAKRMGVVLRIQKR